MGNSEIAGLDIAGMDNDGLDIVGLDIIIAIHNFAAVNCLQQNYSKYGGYRSRNVAKDVQRTSKCASWHRARGSRTGRGSR